MFFEMLIIALLGGVVLACLSWNEIETWLNKAKQPDSLFGEIIRERLASGEFRVVANVFSKAQNKTASEEWRAQSLDETLEKKFAHRDKLRVRVS
jgi:hypothetical protein